MCTARCCSYRIQCWGLSGTLKDLATWPQSTSPATSRSYILSHLLTLTLATMNSSSLGFSHHVPQKFFHLILTASGKASTATILNLRMRKVRLRETKWLSQYPTGSDRNATALGYLLPSAVLWPGQSTLTSTHPHPHCLPDFPWSLALRLPAWGWLRDPWLPF